MVIEGIIKTNATAFCSPTYVDADWDLGNGCTKRAKLHLQFDMAAQI